MNGKPVSISIDDPEMPLLYALRDTLALQGPRFGCGLAQCGACTVHVDGKAMRSCVLPLSKVLAEQKIVTLEGLGTPETRTGTARSYRGAGRAVRLLHQRHDHGVLRLLARNKKPTEAQIKEALAKNLCRCGTHARIIRAVQRAADYV